MHFELFTATRTGRIIRVLCWCPLGTSHSHDDWVRAGRPESSFEPALARR